MFSYNDNWLFDKIYQPITDWFIDTHHRGPHWLAAVTAYAYAALAIVEGIFSPSSSPINLTVKVLSVAAAIWCGMQQNARNLANQELQHETMNPLRIEPIVRFLRAIALIMFVFCVSMLIGNPDTSFSFFDPLRNFLLLCLFYFMSCNTRPPKARRQIQEKLATTPV
jgi:L-asparagine transporter-like permease